MTQLDSSSTSCYACKEDLASVSISKLKKFNLKSHLGCVKNITQSHIYCISFNPPTHYDELLWWIKHLCSWELHTRIQNCSKQCNVFSLDAGESLPFLQRNKIYYCLHFSEKFPKMLSVFHFIFNDWKMNSMLKLQWLLFFTNLALFHNCTLLVPRFYMLLFFPLSVVPVKNVFSSEILYLSFWCHLNE